MTALNIDRGNIANLLGMARTAKIAGNQPEAISYYNRVLEADPAVPEAWLGKGSCAGWSSTLQDVRLNEAVVAFQHAIGSADEEERPAITQQAVIEIDQLATGLYGMAKKHMLEFPGVQTAWAAYVNFTAAAIDALETAIGWMPDYRPALESIVQLCRESIDQGLTEDYAAVLKGKMDGAVEQLRAIDPDYQPPALARVTVAQAQKDEQESQMILMLLAGVAIIVMAVIARMAS